jgi:hypothetical protein
MFEKLFERIKRKKLEGITEKELETAHMIS